LSRIHSEKHTVEFNAKEGTRQDIDGTAYALEQIAIYSPNRKKIRQYEFQTEYFGAPDNKFLKLKRLLQYDTTAVDYIQHEFEYENETTFYGADISSNVDHYGYLNGGGQQANYFPKSIWPGAGLNREPDLAFAKSGALKKITFPTGGSSDMEYEMNTYYDGENYNWHYANNNAWVNPKFTGHTTEVVDTFAINYPQDIVILTYRKPKGGYTPGDSSTHVPSTNTYEARLEYENGDQYVVIGTYQVWLNTGYNSDTVHLTEPGVYRLIGLCDNNEDETSALTMGFKKYQREPIEGRKGAGIRIKKITENPVIGIPVVHNYYYTDDKGFSTGEGLSAPMYMSRPLTRTVIEISELSQVPAGEVLLMDHTSMVAEASERGLPFYYQRVIEDVVSGSAIIRTKYYFSHVFGMDDADLIRQEEFKYEDGIFQKVRKTENTYFANTLDVFNGISIFRTAEKLPLGSMEPLETLYGWEASATYMFWKYPYSSRETLFNGTDSLVTETINYYDLFSYNLNAVKKKNFSDGSTFYTKYKYPEDYTNQSALVAANFVTPLEEQVWSKSPAGDSVMVSGKIYKYNPATTKLEKIYALESATGIPSLDNETKSGGLYTTLVSDSRYKSKIDFTYHSSGKIITQQLTDEAPVSYLWGDTANPQANSSNGWKNYPIAEIQNALPSQVFYTSFEETGVTNHAKTGSKSHNGVYPIPVSYTGNYKLTYWRKTGSGPWTLLESTVTDPNNIQIGASGSWVDEVRLFPTNATIRTFTYLNGWGLSDVNDANNVIAHFTYDTFGRLLSIRDDQANILKNYQYHYKNSGSN
jgi:YD repeat-containing protein